ncbi:hypothetical protein [Helicobacter mesocricetorum]|uniref:hypothetical protein n=1 Tax=Helicobacter mesocricetorum TaxID=87012 RepID=UPI000CF19130|nr:hypothetical protein [Helicobacter mesocricetorum]
MSKIPFSKVFQACKDGEKLPFSVEFEGISLEGFLSVKNSSEWVRLEGVLKGQMNCTCDLSGETYIQTLNEVLDFYLSDGMVNLESGNFRDVVECEDGIIDLAEILRSELEIIRCDYHIKN